MKQDMRNKKRKITEFVKSLFMVMMVFLGVLVLTPSDVKASSPKGIMAYYYVAKGQPCTFQDPQKGTISIKESAGNKCKASGNKITVICQKEGDIVYTINGKKKVFRIYIGGVGPGNGPDKISKKDFNITKTKFCGKQYTNFIDMIPAAKTKKKWNSFYYYFSGKKEVNGLAKYNRKVKYGSGMADVYDAFPSWQDLGSFYEDDCTWTSLYYDKKTGYVVEKGFVYNSKMAVFKVVYYAYNPKKTVVKLIQE